jgi:DNA polymerase
VTSTIGLDYEGFSEAQLVGASSVGLWNYTTDMSTEGLMVAYRIDEQAPRQIDMTQDDLPAEFVEAMLDPEMEKWAFNAAFERVFTMNALGIKTPIKGWRCTMVLAMLQSFTGDLGAIGRAMGIDDDKVKSKEGKRLIQKFCQPQKLTRKNSLYRRTWKTDPDDWQTFLDYNSQDEVAEHEIKEKLIRFPIPDLEWKLYEIDQEINDRGMPVNTEFVRKAYAMAEKRKAELVEQLIAITGLDNPLSGPQFKAWAIERGYPFDDLQKATIKKVLAENETLNAVLAHECVAALKLRQQAARTSIKKYPAIMRRVSPDRSLRHCFQFAGAARTGRWAGRGPQPHNLTRTPKALEAHQGDASKLQAVVDLVVDDDYAGLSLVMEEPMDALAGSVRSSFQAIPDEDDNEQELQVCDLSAIESAVTAWLCKCVRLLKVFEDKRDPYRDFGVELYRKAYDDITGAERTICKPAVLGCTYQLGGGMLFDGKRTGLWGYAEAMGVDITLEESHRQVAVFRDLYHEVPSMWKALEHAVKLALRGTPNTVNGLVHFALRGPYLTVRLPSGRHMYYYRPRMVDRVFTGRDGTTYTREVFSYMGKSQITMQWGRVFSSGGKIIENIVQAIARDVLCVGVLRAHGEGYPIVGTVHDEIIALLRRGSNYFTLELLRECMMAPIEWAPGLPLGAAGYVSTLYRKD